MGGFSISSGFKVYKVDKNAQISVPDCAHVRPDRAVAVAMQMRMARGSG